MGQSTYTRPLPMFPVPGGMPFVTAGAVIPGAAAPKEKKKQERPLFKSPVPGTPWIKVKTTEGNVFWTHKERKESFWEVPDEIREQAETMEREEKEKDAKLVDENQKQMLEARERDAEEMKRKEREEVERVMEEVKDAVAAGKRKADEPADGDKKKGHKKSRVEEAEEPDEQWQREIADEMVQEVEADAGDTEAHEVNETEHSVVSDGKESRRDSNAPTDAAKQEFFKVPDRVDLSIDEAKALFKVQLCHISYHFTIETFRTQTLLREKDINPLNPWDTSLPLFISDPRYVLLPSVSARREAFNEYCRDAARAQRAAKTAAIKEETESAKVSEGEKDKEAYAKLLREEVTSTRATWHEFRRKWKKDRRFFGWAGERERERAFRDWVRDLVDGEYMRTLN